jgi:hypothetical protein
VLDSAALRFPVPAGPASEALNALLDAYDRAVQRRRAVDQEEREVAAAAMAASDEVASLERDRARGDEPPASVMRTAEQKLLKAKARREEPWPERRKAADAVAREAEVAVVTHLQGHGLELAAEVEQEGRDAADAVTDAARVLVDAHRRRGLVESRLVRVVHFCWPSCEQYVTRSLADQLAHVAEAFANRGERAPSIDRALLPQPEREEVEA